MFVTWRAIDPGVVKVAVAASFNGDGGANFRAHCSDVHLPLGQSRQENERGTGAVCVLDANAATSDCELLYAKFRVYAEASSAVNRYNGASLSLGDSAPEAMAKIAVKRRKARRGGNNGLGQGGGGCAGILPFSFAASATTTLFGYACG